MKLISFVIITVLCFIKSSANLNCELVFSVKTFISASAAFPLYNLK